MGARVGVLVLVVLALLGGLAWFTSRGGGAGPEGLSGQGAASLGPGSRAGGASAQRPGDARSETPLQPVGAGPTTAERGALAGGSVRRDAPSTGPGGDQISVEEASVKLVVRASDGRPILEALTEWGLGQHRLTCVGTLQAPNRHQYGSIPPARAPFRFATMQPALVDGQTTFRVNVRRRPSFLSVLVSDVVVSIERVEKETAEIEVFLTEEEVRGAMGGVSLCLVAENASNAPRGRAYLRAEERQLHAQTGAEGCLEFADVPPGEYELAIYANRYASTFLTVDVKPSRVVELGDVTLRPPVAVTGVVTGDERYRANRQVSVQVVDRSGDEMRTRELRRISTDSNGSFRVFDLAAGEYALHVVTPSTRTGRGVSGWPVSPGVLVDTSAGTPASVELPLEKAHTVVVRSALDRDATVELRDESGIAIQRLQIIAKGVQQVGLLPGRYVVVATSAGRIVSRSVFQTPPALTLTVSGG